MGCFHLSSRFNTKHWKSKSKIRKTIYDHRNNIKIHKKNYNRKKGRKKLIETSCFFPWFSIIIDLNLYFSSSSEVLKSISVSIEFSYRMCLCVLMTIKLKLVQKLILKTAFTNPLSNKSLNFFPSTNNNNKQ